MAESKKYDPARRKRLNNPERLLWIPPALVWELAAPPGVDGRRFIDIGAGTGYITAEVARLAGPDVEINALDIEPLMVQEMTEGLPAALPVKPLLMSENLLPFAEASIDGVWMITLYHELQPPQPLLAEIRRVLRPQGTLLVVDWERREEACNQGPPLAHRVHSEDVCAQLKDAGFSQVSSQPGFTLHYAIVATRP
ncbi:MAG: class I SAM-dependent methyltransferase [Thermodesulfobacteriota bacterium]